MQFHGSRIRWLGSRGRDHGIARVAIDDQEMATVDLYATAAEQQSVLYESPLLSPGLHSLVVTLTGQSHPDASGARVCIDCFDVEPFEDSIRIELETEGKGSG